MKKILAIVLALAMVFSFAACGKEKDVPAEAPAPISGVANPIAQYDSLEEVNEELGLRLSQPGVMGVTDNVFQIIDCNDYKIGEFLFKVNGYEYSLRGSSVYDTDISGVYIGEKGTAFEGRQLQSEPDFVFEKEIKLARWATIDGQYVLSVKDEKNEIAEETFKGIADEFVSMSVPTPSSEELAAYYESLAGDYEDTFSQRAVAEVTAYEDYVEIMVHWGSSAFESTMWTMTARLAEDGLLCYSDEKRTDIVLSESGLETDNVVYENEAGFFSVDEEGKLIWNGAFSEDCRECAFVKYN